jgi:putative ABC transport system permease protein
MRPPAETAYRTLLYALPADLRREFGDDMLQLFRDHRGACAGRLARLRLWLAAAADVGREAIALRTAAMRARGIRDRRGGMRSALRNFFADAAHGLRLMRRAPGASLLAILTLALGIGANTAIFSVFDAVMLRALPYPDPDRLVRVFEKRPAEGVLNNSVSPADFLDWERRQTPFTHIAALVETGVTLTGAGEPEQIGTGAVTSAFFDVLGVQALHGRTFRDDEDAFGRHYVVVLTHGLWVRKFGGDPSVIGRTVTLNGVGRQVVGVLPASFRYPNPETEIWAPAVLEAPEQPAPRALHQLDVFARLKPDVTLEQARHAMDQLGAALEAEHPDTNTGHGAWVATLRDEWVGPVSTSLGALFAAVGLVLLIACVNVASLQLAQAIGRRREMAVRSALGATRARLLGQSFAEHLGLAAIGGTAGLAVASVTLGVLPHVLPEQLSVVDLRDVALDARVFAFTVGVTLIAGLAVGLLPALAASRPSVTDVMSIGGRGHTGRRRRMRTALIVSEVALAALILVGAGLVLRSFTGLLAQPLGFDVADRLTFTVSVPSVRYQGTDRRRAAMEEIEQRLAHAPGVAAAGAINLLPIGGGNSRAGVEIDGRETTEEDGPTRMHPRVVTPAYFDAMGIRIVEGRGFTAEDRAGGRLVAIVSEASVRRFYPNRSPIGTRIRFTGSEDWRTIVGVAVDVKHWGPRRAAEPMLYQPFAQAPWSAMTFVLKTDVEPMSAAPAARQAVAGFDPLLPLASLRTLDARLGEVVRADRAQTVLMGAFGVLALALAVLGIYGVTSQLVAARVPEIGVRMTLGARPRDVLRQILGEGLWQAIAGVVAGIAAGALLMRLGESLLFGVSPWDPPTLAAVAVVLITAALLACLLPARRAMRVDPVEALRS